MSPSEDDCPFTTACRATTRAEFVDALNQLRQSRGLSYKRVSDNAGERMLPKSTAHALCTIRFPKREDQLRAFLIGCGEDVARLDGWVEQWQRLRFRQPRRYRPINGARDDVWTALDPHEK
jgi:hypothetical protein